MEQLVDVAGDYGARDGSSQPVSGTVSSKRGSHLLQNPDIVYGIITLRTSAARSNLLYQHFRRHHRDELTATERMINGVSVAVSDPGGSNNPGSNNRGSNNGGLEWSDVIYSKVPLQQDC